MSACGKKLFKLGYEFKNLELLDLALTHSAVSGLKNNQRLEFLGDSILNLIVAGYLYNSIQDATEGELTRIRSFLVQGSTLKLIAEHLKIQDSIYLGAGELKTGGLNKDSILEDTLESLIAAIYLDSDLVTTSNLIISWYKEIKYINPDGSLNSSHKDLLNKKDPKTMLQELLHAKGLNLPIYEIINITGKPHQQKFKVSCSVDTITSKVYGVGSSRKKAEQQAASKILELLL